MRLTELEPHWFTHAGNERAGFLFRCPHCRKVWLSCTLVGMNISEQEDAFIPEECSDIVPCEQGLAWKVKGDSFESITITPSLDSSKSGHWHGHITDGNIVGGEILGT